MRIVMRKTRIILKKRPNAHLVLRAPGVRNRPLNVKKFRIITPQQEIIFFPSPCSRILASSVCKENVQNVFQNRPKKNNQQIKSNQIKSTK